MFEEKLFAWRRGRIRRTAFVHALMAFLHLRLESLLLLRGEHGEDFLMLLLLALVQLRLQSLQTRLLVGGERRALTLLLAQTARFVALRFGRVGVFGLNRLNLLPLRVGRIQIV